MKKILAATLIGLMTLPAFAQSNEVTTDISNDALPEGMIPADQLDSLEFQQLDENGVAVEADGQSFLQRRPGQPGRGPGRGPGRPGPGRPGPGRPGPRPQPPRRPPPRAVTCEARDRQGYTYRATDWNLSQARWAAMAQCERQTRSGGCRLRGCY